MNPAPPPQTSPILVVDDTPANIQTLAAILKQPGCQLSVATNGKQALEVLARVNTHLTLNVLRRSQAGKNAEFHYAVTPRRIEGRHGNAGKVALAWGPFVLAPSTSL